MTDNLSPPPALGSHRVIAYAVIDDDVKFTGKQRLFVDGQELGAVPRVAICKSLQSDVTDYLVLYCNLSWETLGVSGAPTLDLAKAEAERCYAGISGRWVAVDATADDARKWLVNNHPEEVCQFCGRLFYETEILFSKGSGVICSRCVADFAQELSIQPVP